MSQFPLVPSVPLAPLTFVPILLSEVEQEQRPSGNGDREAIVVGAGLCDGECKRAYIGYAPHYNFAFNKSVFADVDNCLAHFAKFRCPFCRISMPTLPNFDAHFAEKKFGNLGQVGTLCRIRRIKSKDYVRSYTVYARSPSGPRGTGRKWIRSSVQNSSL